MSIDRQTVERGGRRGLEIYIRGPHWSWRRITPYLQRGVSSSPPPGEECDSVEMSASHTVPSTHGPQLGAQRGHRRHLVVYTHSQRAETYKRPRTRQTSCNRSRNKWNVFYGVFHLVTAYHLGLRRASSITMLRNLFSCNLNHDLFASSA